MIRCNDTLADRKNGLGQLDLNNGTTGRRNRRSILVFDLPLVGQEEAVRERVAGCLDSKEEVNRPACIRGIVVRAETEID